MNFDKIINNVFGKKKQNLFKINNKLFGDFDNDKVLNFRDCKPFNKNKQGPWHKYNPVDNAVDNIIKGKDKNNNNNNDNNDNKFGEFEDGSIKFPKRKPEENEYIIPIKETDMYGNTRTRMVIKQRLPSNQSIIDVMKPGGFTTELEKYNHAIKLGATKDQINRAKNYWRFRRI